MYKSNLKYVHTPKHELWLNLIETLFGKMARTFLKAIGVNTRGELKQRILNVVEEIIVNLLTFCTVIKFTSIVILLQKVSKMTIITNQLCTSGRNLVFLTIVILTSFDNIVFVHIYSSNHNM